MVRLVLALPRLVRLGSPKPTREPDVVVSAVRLRAAAAVVIAGLLVLPVLHVLPPALAATVGVLAALAVTLPGAAVGSARRAGPAAG
jgi:hypothetical protein